MITDSFDAKSPARINVKKNENAVPVDAVIYTFSHEIEKYVKELGVNHIFLQILP